MNGAEGARLSDAITAGRWGATLEVLVVQAVLAAEVDGRNVTRVDLAKRFKQYSAPAIRLVVRHFLTRQVLQQSGKILYLQRDFGLWQDRKGRPMFAEKGSAAALADRQKEATAHVPKPQKLAADPLAKPKPTTVAEVKERASMGRIVGDLMRDILKG